MSAVYFAEGANASFKEFVSVFTYVRPCVFVCNRVFSCCGPLSPAQRWPRSCCSVVVISQFACLCGSAAPLVLSLIPGSGKHQPLKLKRQGFFFFLSPCSTPHTKFGEQLGRPWWWFVSLCPSVWQVESVHTQLHTAPHKLFLIGHTHTIKHALVLWTDRHKQIQL